MNKILVYGSLREGLINYTNYLASYKPIETFELKGFKMYNLGGYPMVMRDTRKDNKIIVESYEIEERDYEIIQFIEKGAGYREAQVDIKGVKYSLFCYDWIPKSAKEIIKGDYKEYLKENGYF